MQKYSIIHFVPDRKGYSCGYCKSIDTNFSDGMWAHGLTVQDYQDLIDRGWRRSGRHCYKPIMDVTCCPLYTIKCEALEFKPSKSQKKVLKKMHRFLENGNEKLKPNSNQNSGEFESEAEGGHFNDIPDLDEKANMAEKNKEGMVIEKVELPDTVDKINETNNIGETSEMDTVETVFPVQESGCNYQSMGQTSKLKTPKCGQGIDHSKPLCKKAKVIRLEKKQKKQSEHGALASDTCAKKQLSKEKSLEDFIDESFSKTPAHNLELKLVRSCPMSDEFRQSFDAELELYQKYQQSVHQDPPGKCNKQLFTRFLVTSPLMVRLVASQSANHDVETSWRLYVKYQTTIHKETVDECNFDTFYNFLVATPLKPYKPKQEGPSCGYGSFHQQYWLDGKLLAVGVIDILPKCLSSVYFFYDPDYAFLTLGTYGSLREVAFVRSLVKQAPALQNYYMGFYVHSCPKMRYKARLYPSYLLCPEVYTWHPVELCIPKLDMNKYSRLNDDKNAACKNSEIDIDEVLVLWNRIAMPYKRYKSKGLPGEEEVIRQYSSLVGRTCAERMLYYVHRE